MPDGYGYRILSDEESKAFLEAKLAEWELKRDQDRLALGLPAKATEPVQPPADSAEQIKKDYPWLFPDEPENT